MIVLTVEVPNPLKELIFISTGKNKIAPLSQPFFTLKNAK